MRFPISRRSTHEFEPSAIIVRDAFCTIIQAGYRCCGANGTLAAQAMLSRARASEQLWSLIERDDNAKCKGNISAYASEMFALCIHSLKGFDRSLRSRRGSRPAANICNSIEPAQQTFTLLRTE
jgi:hypothetical protein